MPASSMYRRPLSRSSAHRQSLLKNLTESLIQHESISTTYAKAKETQRVVEKLITLGKKGTEASRLSAAGFLHTPEKWLSKVFGPLAKRYKERPGGYTRLLQCEPLKDDQARSAVLSLVDGPKDMRFNMTAKALLRQQEQGLPINEITATNVRKVTRFRSNGISALAQAVESLKTEKVEMEAQEKKAFEKDGTRFKWTAELARSDPRWKDKRGPGSMVRRKIGPDDDEDPLS